MYLEVAGALRAATLTGAHSTTRAERSVSGGGERSQAPGGAGRGDETPAQAGWPTSEDDRSGASAIWGRVEGKKRARRRAARVNF